MKEYRLNLASFFCFDSIISLIIIIGLGYGIYHSNKILIVNEWVEGFMVIALGVYVLKLISTFILWRDLFLNESLTNHPL